MPEEQKDKKFRIALTYYTEVVVGAKDCNEANYIARNFIEDYLDEWALGDTDIWTKTFTVTEEKELKHKHKHKKQTKGETT